MTAPLPGAFLARWHAVPLYLRIVGALVFGVMAGVARGPRAAELAISSRLIPLLLSAIAPPLILIAIVHALLTADFRGGVVRRLEGLLRLNTLVAICIGLLVANVARSGRWARLQPPPEAAVEKASDPRVGS